jgi:hypothetical protein
VVGGHGDPVVVVAGCAGDGLCRQRLGASPLPIMATPAVDETTKVLMALIAAGMLWHFAVRWLRRVRPSPIMGA